MTDKQEQMLTFARCRRLATEAAAVAALDARPARPATTRPVRTMPPTSLRPTRAPSQYCPDLSGVPPIIIAGLLKAIAAIDRHDATLTGDTIR